MQPFDAPLALSIDEAARQANLCRDALYAAIREGKLEAKKSGRRTLIMADALRRFLDGLPALALPPASPRSRKRQDGSRRARSESGNLTQ